MTFKATEGNLIFVYMINNNACHKKAFANIYTLQLLLLAAVCIIFSPSAHAQSSATAIWKLTDTMTVGNFRPVVLGKPTTVKYKGKGVLSFNGINDGLIIPAIPVTDWSAFTIEVLINPPGDGPSAPRFLHFQDKAGNRCTMEMRIVPGGQWYLDEFIKNGTTNQGLTLIDSTLLHPTDQWYWIALSYDGKQLRSYVNGVMEHEGAVACGPFGKGETAIGVRLNKINWFKGQISELQFHPAVLNNKALKQ